MSALLPIRPRWRESPEEKRLREHVQMGRTDSLFPGFIMPALPSEPTPRGNLGRSPWLCSIYSI